MKVKSYAKINIGLNILFKRQDSYHELESIMCSVDLYDELEFKKTESEKIFLKCNLNFINYRTNLVYIIARDLKKQFNVTGGLNIFIQKNIPVSGGMAGGSTNAAATIKVLNELWNLNLSMSEMMKIGQKYGADIPFCINEKPAVVTGIGEKVVPFTFKSNFNVIVVKMPFGLSTKSIFENLNFDVMPFYSINAIKKALETQDNILLTKNLGNNMEEVSLVLKPQIKEVKDLLIELGCFTSLMSGSGPTVLGFIEKEKEYQSIIDKLEELGYSAYYTKIIE